MSPLERLERLLAPFRERPVAFVVAGHNGSGKSTLWRERLAPGLQIPLLNADRMLAALLPEPVDGFLPDWAEALRDGHSAWQRIAQLGVTELTTAATDRGVRFAYETVFSDWHVEADGSIRSKVRLIEALQAKGYVVVLLFVGLSSVQVSIGRVDQRFRGGGHSVDVSKLVSRFPRTQQAISHAKAIADVSMFFDNSGELADAYTLAYVRTRDARVYDLRDDRKTTPAVMFHASTRLDIVAPRA